MATRGFGWDTMAARDRRVILTSSNEERDLVESYRLNANAYVRKPVDFEKYQHVVEQLGTFWLKVNESAPHEVFKSRG